MGKSSGTSSGIKAGTKTEGKVFIAYYRVSTQKQGISGLGLEAQQKAVSDHLQAIGGALLTSYTEIESGTRNATKRPQLAAALAQCKKSKAVLILAKLDRLARNVAFVSSLLETGVDFIACDMPSADRTMIQMFSVMAEYEARQISQRTKAALQAAKARGVKLGTKGRENLSECLRTRQRNADEYATKLRHVIDGMAGRGLSEPKMVTELNALGIKAPRGGEFTPTQLRRIRARLAGLSTAQSA